MTDQERLAPLPVEQWGEGTLETITAHMSRPERFLGPGAKPMPNAMGLLARHLPLGDGWLAFNGILANQTTIDVRLRELIILRVAWLTRSAYEWSQHTRLALRVGLTTQHLHAIPDGSAAGLWSPVERVVLAATEQLVERHRIDDATWAQLCEHLDEKEAFELLFVTGTYTCFAMVCNGAGLQLDAMDDDVDAPVLPDDI